ncbi:MAG: S1 RNA-binding domain-containing protein [Chloroflexi bacterium]|nr:S1 RNA-binding domain-containing protein [Chloroflexota bacterium]MCI0579359.1 S1 RNA-binding domain-containing protein [Chloroflexota bacterium]MCI0646008.1 S1 RNA-binding domain-containing protein [Chloroflexota bacterium]MCI0727430.1 S1 RNA-binding domain-containing protein [Chloroflexota bacterium]
MAEEFTETIEETIEPAAPAAASQNLSDLRPKMRLKGTVKRLELYGAFIDLGVGANAILHISQLGQQVNRISDVMNVGDEIEVWVDKVDPERNQVTVTMVEPLAVEWSDLQDGQVYTGTVTRLEKFGAFVDIGAEKEGLVHVSELSHEYVKHPSEAVKVGDEIQVKVLGFSKRKRRIDLSRKALVESPTSQRVAEPVMDYDEEEEEDEFSTSMALAWQAATGQTTRRRSKAGKKSRAHKEKMRSQQEEILSRTLKINPDTRK